MAEPVPLALSAAIGRTPCTEALFTGAAASPWLRLDLAPVPVISRAFAPMVREGRYDVSEMAIATFLAAKAAGKDLVLLPAVLAARFQEDALLCRAEGAVRGPADLGGPTDAFARLLSQRLSTDLGRSIVVDNRGGANGTISMASAAHARPDGYAVVIAPNSTYAVAPHLYKVRYEQERDFVGVGLLVSSPLFMLVPRNSPVKSVAEYVASAKQPRSRLDYANAGVGATSHLATEMFLQSAGIEVTEVGYRGGGPAIQAAIAGEVGMLFMPAAAVMPFIQWATSVRWPRRRASAARSRPRCRPSKNSATQASKWWSTSPCSPRPAHPRRS